MKQPPNSAYWKKRFKAIENQANLTGANNLAYIVEQYLQAMKELETQISVWYTRFAKNNGITLHEAKKQLSGAALKEFQWTVQEYIQYGEENALNGAWMKQLENASAKWHITRLDALKLQNQAAIEALFGKQEQSLTRALMKIYPTSYYHTCYEVQKAFEIGWDIASVDEKKLAAALSTPWTLDGSTFSDRLWSNKQKLIQNTQSTLTQGIMLGKTPDKLIAELQKKMKTSQSNAGRLVMTETAALSAMGQKDAFRELGVEEFEIVETLDNMTCEVCAEMDGQHFPMSEYEIGVTAPPFHPWCRGCTCPYFHDEFTADSERIARGEDGKQYYVLGDTTYQEWKQAFVDGDKSGLQEINSSATMKADTPVVKSVEDTQTFEEMKSYMKNNYNIVVDDSVGLLDFQSVREGVQGIEYIMKEFPQAQSSFKSIGTKKEGLMCAGYDGDINFNPGYYQTRKTALQNHGIGEGISPSGLHPKGNNCFGSGSHEAGHILEKALVDKISGESILGGFCWRDCTYAKAVVSDACKAAKKLPECKGMTNSELKGAISGYAKQDASECLAEAVCDVSLNGAAAAPLAKIIWEILKKELG